MSQELLKDGGFEADWGEEKSHRTLIFPKDKEPYEKDVGNIFTPPNWITWFYHDPGTWDQPEVRDAWKSGDPRRVHSGQKGMLLFTFWRRHDAGFLQQVQVTPGTKVRLTAWAHAWSNWHDGAHPDDPRWSDGPGYEAGFALEGDVQGDNWRNFTFYVGIDPTGGTNPFADTVVWGQGAHIYNKYAQVPAAEATAQATVVTVFLRSKTLWPFKHNDAYWDDASLVVMNGEPPKAAITFEPAQPKTGDKVMVTISSTGDFADVDLIVTGPDGAGVAVSGPQAGVTGGQYLWQWTFTAEKVGTYRACFTADGGALTPAEGTVVVGASPEPEWAPPRVPYARTYVLLPQDAGRVWPQAVLNSGKWEERHWTIGSSADDAGAGPKDRTVIAVNPGKWPGDLRAFFQQYYPGIKYVPVEAASPRELETKLRAL
ncbi:MAG: emp24/gp25L/p24 family protein [Anaerolineae bacterium]|nr:emp24/gp25L/p24 family protein [Anaerolineae bacterium]